MWNRFVLSLPQLVGNHLRTRVRDGCRAWTHSAADYNSLTDVATTDGAAMRLGCGWSGLPIRANLTAPDLYLSFSVGTCSERAFSLFPPCVLRPVSLTHRASCARAAVEYSSASAEMLPVEGPAPGGSPLFVRTPHAGYCLPGTGTSRMLSSVSFWLQFVNCVLFFLFLMKLRRNQVHSPSHGARPFASAFGEAAVGSATEELTAA